MKHLFILLIVIATGNCFAQGIESAVINTTGGSHTEANIIYDWNVGELALVETMINSKGIISNGLLQPILPIHIITDGFPIFPANILTANRDGKNDAWVIKDIERYPDNDLTILDRGGRVVYQTKNYQNDWAGTLSGTPLSEDTYFYVLKLRKNGLTAIKKGFITILN
jgi:gliding motility-associated-like protein